MSSINKVILVGNVCADPEERTFQSGGKVVNLRLATNERWKDKTTGERKEKAEYHTVSVYSEGLVNLISKYVKKGSKLYIEGRLETRKWADNQGNERYTTEVVLRAYQSNILLLDKREQQSEDIPF